MPPGRYWLIHARIPRRLLREVRYGNNAASILIRLSWPNGRRSAPRISVLLVCEASARC